MSWIRADKVQIPTGNLSRYLEDVFGPEGEEGEDMAPYHSLSECTLSPAERLEEASRLIAIISRFDDELSSKERNFIESLESSCSVKQLFWLRDIKDRVVS